MEESKGGCQIRCQQARCNYNASYSQSTESTSGVDKSDQAPNDTSTDTVTADPAPDANKPNEPSTTPGTTNAIRVRPESPSFQAERGRTPTRSHSKTSATTAKEEPDAGKEKADKEEKPKPDAEEKPKEEEKPAAEEAPNAEPKDAETKPDAEAQSKQWNAVCVLGLRVYSLDKNVVVKLVRPESGEGGGLVGNKE
jgi:hypothetical protein